MLVFLVAAAALAALTFVVFEGTARDVAHHFAAQYAAREALLQQSRVAALVNREVALAMKLADDPVIRAWALNEEDPGLARTAAGQLESYRGTFRSGSYFVALARTGSYYVYDVSPVTPDRRVVRKTTLRSSNPSDQWFFETLRGDEPFVLNVDENTMLGEVKVWVDVVLRDENGRAIGVGGTGIDLADFLGSLRDSARGEAQTVLFDRRGVVEAHWDRALVERNARAGAGPKTTIYDLVAPADEARLRAAMEAAAAPGESAHLTTLHVQGKTYLAALTFMKAVGWYDLVLLEEGHILSPRAFLPLLLAMAAGVALLFGALALLLDRTFIRPVAELTSAAQRVAGGDYEARVPEVRRDELGLLARTFNAMTGKILEYTHHLREKVEERTRQLADSNAALRAAQARTDESLRYAQAIQTTILPTPEMLEADLGPHALLYRPRDVVGGDFYHHTSVPDGSLTLVLDCTGHGVPGAFISMTASATLQHVLAEGILEPDEVLAHLNRGLRQTRHQSAVRGALDAGLDVLACRIDHRARTVTVATAGLPFFMVQDGAVQEYPGDRQRVGYHGSDPEHRFESHVLAPDDGARLYVVTDGVLDHAGGEKGFGFGTPRLKVLLASLSGVAMSDQAPRIEATLRSWAGARPQRDDLTLLGIEIRWRGSEHVRT